MKKVFRIFLLVLFLGVFVFTIGYLYKKSRKKPAVYELKSPFVSNLIKKK